MKKITYKTVRRAAQCLGLAAVAITTAICLACAASATGWQSSPIATGTEKLLTDLSNWILIICPIIGVLACGYFFLRRAIADEQDGKLWTRRITTAIICTILGMLVGGLIKLIASYYGVTIS